MPNTYNPNEMTKRQQTTLAKEIKTKGFLQPILVNKQHIIIDGEHRWRAAQEAKLEEIPCIICICTC